MFYIQTPLIMCSIPSKLYPSWLPVEKAASSLVISHFAQRLRETARCIPTGGQIDLSYKPHRGSLSAKRALSATSSSARD